MKHLLNATALTLMLAVPLQAATYVVDVDGANIDLTGSIEFTSTGTFTADTFQAAVGNFSITATGPTGAVYTFDQNNSAFGAGQFGNAVSFNVSSTAISLTSTATGNFDADGLFLVANVVTNNARENLRLTTSIFGFRQPAGFPSLVTDPIRGPFVLGETVAPVPLPSGLPLLAAGLFAIGYLGRRAKKT